MASEHGSHIIKRRGHSEPLDKKKIYASAYAACLSHELGEQKCEQVAEKVMKEVIKEITSRHNAINSAEIAELTFKALEKIDKDVAFLYKTHLDLS